MLIVILNCSLICICTAPIWGTLLFHIWEQFIKPRFVPQAEITRMARQLVIEYGPDCDERAATEEHYAWHRGDIYQQAVWRRVRLELDK